MVNKHSPVKSFSHLKTYQILSWLCQRIRVGSSRILRSSNLKSVKFIRDGKNGLRLDRFYAGVPVCFLTTASFFLTGRANDRTVLYFNGEPIRMVEKTKAEVL